MGRRRQKHSHFTPRQVDVDKDVDDIDPDSSRFVYDEIDHFHAKRDGINLSDVSDSEKGIQKQQKKHYRVRHIKPKYIDEENEDKSDDDVISVDDDLGFDEEEGDEDEDQPFADIPSSKAWGKNKSSYYGGEDVKDVRGLDREDMEDAEEEEALKIQKRLAEEIDEDQFELFKIPETVINRDESSKKVEKVDIDINSLSVKAQWKLLKQESPELQELISDFKIKAAELKQRIAPFLDLVKSGKIIGSGAVYVQTKFNLYLSYLLNVSFYMSLKAKRTVLTGHPIIKRLAQYRTLINKLSRLDEKLENEIELLLQSNETTTAFVDESANDEAYDGDEEEMVVSDEAHNTRAKEKQTSAPLNPEQTFVSLSERIRLENEKTKEVRETSGGDKEPAEEEERRAVTDKIKKNKGYLNKKKKKLGNPRIKHKEKYRKAIIRRKGQVREYRAELKKYSGEATGIKASVVRSRQIR